MHRLPHKMLSGARGHGRWSVAFLPVVVAVQLLVCPTALFADGDNWLFSFPLHAEMGLIDSCDPVRSVSCWCGPPYLVPVNIVPPDVEITVFLLASNYCGELALHGVQTAFEWDSSWKLLGSSWDCQSNQLCATTPHDPGGPHEGAIATVFDCAAGNWSEVVGRMYFRTGSSGCLRQVEPDYPFGWHVLDCEVEANYLPSSAQERLGSICVAGEYAQNGCWDPGPVEDSTWGQIKARYSK